MTDDANDVLASLGRKLDSLDLTDAERAALIALLPAPEVEGFGFMDTVKQQVKVTGPKPPRDPGGSSPRDTVPII